MGYEGSWSGMRKYLEKEMLADSIKGRVRYGCTCYPGMDGCKIFEVCIDNKYKKQFSWETLYADLGKKGYPKDERNWGQMVDYTERIPAEERDAHMCREFCDALAEYRNQDIKNSIESDNPIVRMFAILDRRTGKRTLEKLKDNVTKQPEWLQKFYLLRLEAENINKG
ncbi:MAG: hypothetical protein IKK09_08510 [Clostridia bacterium]|nr:hypothetical protein [Clostridia bacterium]